MEREIRNLCARMEDMETSRRGKDDVGDTSESKGEEDTGHGGEEIPAEDATNERLIKAIARMRKQKWTFQLMKGVWMQKSC
jgi:hypothetical protein